MIALCFSPDPRYRRDRRRFQREAVFRFQVLFAGELKEGGSRNKAAIAVGEMSPLRPEVEDRRPTRSPGWETLRLDVEDPPVSGWSVTAPGHLGWDRARSGGECGSSHAR
jgi:hypothetical protein